MCVCVCVSVYLCVCVYLYIYQSWIFTGRTDAEADVPILWPPDAKNWLIEKDPEAGKGWRQEEMGMTEDEPAGKPFIGL